MSYANWISLAYAGIGSRETPNAVLELMVRVAKRLQLRGYLLRSGGADGADTAFEIGAEGAPEEIERALLDLRRQASLGWWRNRVVQEPRSSEVYLPWRLFNDHRSPLIEVSEGAFELAARFHPAWGRCSQAARKLHARNGHQILGPNLATPSKFVVCWTKDGEATGGTGQAIRIAKAHDIPVYNLFKPDAMKLLGELVLAA